MTDNSSNARQVNGEGTRYQRLEGDEDTMGGPPAFTLDDEHPEESAAPHSGSSSTRSTGGNVYNQIPAQDPPSYPDDLHNVDNSVEIDPAILSTTEEPVSSPSVAARGKDIYKSFTKLIKKKTSPSHTRLATANPDEPRVSRGPAGNAQTDGVFSNLSAKPDTKPGSQSDEPDLPPDYSEVAEDQAPPYLDLTAANLTSLVGVESEDGEIYIHGYPVGSSTAFFISMLVSMSFQFVGFLLTYFLSTSHAGKNGSRAGFGVTLIQFGLYFRQKAIKVGHPDPSGLEGHDPDHMTLEAPSPPTPPEDSQSLFHHAHHLTHSAAAFITADWFAYIMMLTGWFLIIRSISDFIRVKRTERLIKAGVEVAGDNPAVEIRSSDDFV